MNETQRQISSSLTGRKSQTGDISLECVLYGSDNMRRNPFLQASNSVKSEPILMIIDTKNPDDILHEWL